MGFITAEQVEQLADKIPNDYGSYLKEILRGAAHQAGPVQAAGAGWRR